MREYAGLVIVSLTLAALMHLDWHVARPATHHLSLGWSRHWLLALPVFPCIAWYVDRRWPTQRTVISLVVLGMALLLAGVVEPALEFWLAGATWEWAFGTPRWRALGSYTGAGAIAGAATFALLARRSAPRRAASRPARTVERPARSGSRLFTRNRRLNQALRAARPPRLRTFRP